MKKIIISMMLIETVAYGAVKSYSLEHGRFEVDRNRLSGVMNLRPAPSGNPKISFLSGDRSFGADAEKAPVNLWVLVDNSRSCTKAGFDKKFPGIIGKLQSQLHSDSLVSVVSYTRDNIEIHANHRNSRTINKQTIRCDENGLAGSFDSAFMHLAKNAVQSILPTVVWVYSSGQTAASNQMISTVRSQSAQVEFVLYNMALAKTAGGEIQNLREQKNMPVHFSVLNEQLPSMKYFVNGRVPQNLTGQNLTLSLQGKMGSMVSVGKAFSLHIPLVKPELVDYLPSGMLFLAIVGLVFIIYKVVRYYRGNDCRQCGRRKRSSDRQCPLCAVGTESFVVGRFNYHDPRKWQKLDVAQLKSQPFTIGTRRSSHLRVLAPKIARGRKFVKIHRETTQKGKAFRISPLWENEHFPIEVNGSALTRPRYLAGGDVIRLGNTELTFLAGENHAS